ncbi:MAG: DNA-binding transcriptional regulator [Planctomycetia bacterium]|nr:DNA-binding transcriptional regulator [Planctomycetia bacterium]
MVFSRKKKRRVVVIIETTRAYSREVIRGIARYNREHGDWMVEFSPRGLEDHSSLWLKDWRADGIFARINSTTFMETILETGIPTIDLRRTILHPKIPQIGPDDRKVTELLFHHFRQLGFLSFGFLGVRAEPHTSMAIRRKSFAELVKKEKLQYSQLIVSDVMDNTYRLSARKRNMYMRIRKWLQELPPQTAIVGCNDDMAFRILEECRSLGIAIPDTFAIAGIGNDECFCELGHPSMTSVDLNPQRIGYEAAVLLEKLMRGEKVPHASYVEPWGVVPRVSSDTVATDDEAITIALQFIREHACEEIGIRDVLDQVHLSRVSLEKRFKKFLGRTIYQEIMRLRLDHVRKLLATTQMSHKQIAREAGFRYQEYMMRVFRQMTGMTLKKYRETNRIT